ncbi:PepSY domain-containing protein [Frankia sp. R43]|uniref:PepSY-associated TM helix domain-containing protein n=1 Tax=Frankia sp. R43 TaxID=269536 RepID=UPI0009F95626|nr:PepSY domain-containing protein [Frankia sp. R43]
MVEPPGASPDDTTPATTAAPEISPASATPTASPADPSADTSFDSSAGDPTGTPAIPAPRTPDTAWGSRPGDPASGGWRWLLMRLHFYAGVLVAPFLLVAATTGLAYAFTPQLDRLVYADEFFVDEVGSAQRPLAEQIDAALAAYPDGAFGSVHTGEAPDRTTQVVLFEEALGDKQRTVYVDPYTGEVQGALVTWWGSTPLTTWLDQLHINLHLGDTGLYYSEFAASWLWVIALGGLVLWLARRRRRSGARTVLLPDLTARGRRRTLGWHGSLGVWLVAGLLFLSATGLTWSTYAGGHFSDLKAELNGERPSLDTTLPAAATASASGGAGHEGHGGSGSGDDTSAEGPGTEPVDTVLTAARRAGLDGPVDISPPAEAGTAWSVAQTDNTWPIRGDKVAIDADGTVVHKLRFSDWPLLAQLSYFGIMAHMGILLGLPNQILLASLALGLICLIVWGYRMWWQRRPTRADRTRIVGAPPARGTWRHLSKPALVVTVLVTAAIGWALPVLGVSLGVFILIDILVGVARRRTRQQQETTAA